jgi:hypothetical protein
MNLATKVVFSTLTSAALCTNVSSAADIFNTSASFLAQVGPGSYLNPFSTGGDSSSGGPIAGPLNFSGGSYSYVVTTGDAGFYFDNITIGNWNSGQPVVFDFTGSPTSVTALGFNVFMTDVSGAFFDDTAVSIALSDGTTDSFTPASISEYRGYTAAVPITSIAFQPVARFYNIDNLTVGSVIPEPAALGVLAGIGALALRRKRA